MPGFYRQVKELVLLERSWELEQVEGLRLSEQATSRCGGGGASDGGGVVDETSRDGRDDAESSRGAMGL